MRLIILFLVAGLCASHQCFATDWGVSPPEKSEFGMGLFVEDAGTLAKAQETICIDGVCYPVTTVTTHAPVATSFVISAPQEGTEVASDPPILAVEVCEICGLPKANVSAGVTTTTVTSSVVTRKRGWGLFGNRTRPGLFARWATGWRASKAARSAIRGW